MEEKVVIKVTSDEGHTEFTLTKKEAVSKLTELYDGGQRWIYLNGSVVSPRIKRKHVNSGHRNQSRKRPSWRLLL